MKKSVISVACAAAMVLTSCASNSASSSPVSSSAASSATVSSSAAASSGSASASTSDISGAMNIQVDNGLLTDSITIPADLVKGKDINQIKADAKKDGIADVIQNKDGSITYKMTKAAHQKLIDETKAETITNLNKFKGSKDFPYIKDMSTNDDLSEITLLVDKSQYNDMYSKILLLDMGMEVYFFQIIEGVKPDATKMTLKFEDNKTKKVFDTLVFPDALKETSSSK